MLLLFAYPEFESNTFCLHVCIGIHGVTLRKTVFYTVNAVPTSNVAYWSKMSSFPISVIWRKMGEV